MLPVLPVPACTAAFVLPSRLDAAEAETGTVQVACWACMISAASCSPWWRGWGDHTTCKSARLAFGTS